MMLKLFVFDLDFTLWNTGGIWCDCTVPPYHKKNGQVFDSTNNHLFLYPDTLPILNELSDKGYLIAVASRTSQPDWAIELMKLFGIDHFFAYKEIYPSTKINHLKKISKDSGYSLEKLIFFDDEYRNINDARSIGVKAVFVKNGITKPIVDSYS